MDDENTYVSGYDDGYEHGHGEAWNDARVTIKELEERVAELEEALKSIMYVSDKVI